MYFIPPVCYVRADLASPPAKVVWDTPVRDHSIAQAWEADKWLTKALTPQILLPDLTPGANQQNEYVL